jgi:hypothetical protein|nr:hypothetical protein [Kofleriaceae bacterium]
MRRLYPLFAMAIGACASAGAPQFADSNNDRGGDAQSDAPQRRLDGGTDASQATGDARPIDSGGGGTCPDAVTGALATWSFTGASGSQVSTDASATATGMVAGAISRSPALTAVAGSGSINASGWPAGSTHDSTHYFTLSVTPPSGCAMDLTSVSIDTKASGSGPTGTQLATSADSFASATTFTVSTTATANLSVSGATSAVELRVYGYGAGSNAGTLRVTGDLVVTGTLR